MIVGITGKSGVGKTTLAKKLFPSFYRIAFDEVAHVVLADPLVEKMVKETLHLDGEFSTKQLGEIVFTNRHAYEQVSDIVWEKMKSFIDQEMAIYTDVVLDWILLPHCHYFKMCDVTILVEANEWDRIQKVMERDNISLDYLKKRDSFSPSFEESGFDYVIVNNYRR